MNGYVEAGYVVVLGTLSVYGVTLVTRERAARRRVGAALGAVQTRLRTEAPAPRQDAPAVNHGGLEDGEQDSGP
ncbi:MAG: hypothetical protein ACLPUG_09660 [Acidimicrobiales bacterium]|jgi:hypothetical protein